MRFAPLLLLLLAVIGCDTVSEYGNRAMEWAGLGGSDEKPAKTLRERLPSRRERARGQHDPRKPPITPPEPGKSAEGGPATGGGEDTDIIITKTEEEKTRKVEKKDLKSAERPEFRVEAPVDVRKRVGGAARFILDDGQYLYLDFPQHFAVYDRGLNFLARIPIAFPLREITRFALGGKTYLYLKEENDVLEIVEFVRNIGGEGETFELKDVVSYEVGGDFRWLDPKTLVIFLEKKLQVLDFSDFNEIKILTELPVADVTDALAVDKYIYLSRKGFLDILDAASYKLLSSLRVGRNFAFLRLIPEKPQPRLALALTGDGGTLAGIQFLRLTEDRSGVSDFGETVVLETPLQRYYADFDAGLIFGETATETGAKADEEAPPVLFSLKEKRLLRGELGERRDLMAWCMAEGRVFLVTPLEIAIARISLDKNVMHALAGPASKPAPTPAGRGRALSSPPPPVPLAQIGARKTLKDEYALLPEKSVEFMADARKVALLDMNHFVVFEYRPRQGRHQVFTSTDFERDDFTLAEASADPPAVFTRLQTSDIGLFAYAKEDNALYFMDVGLKSLRPLPVRTGSLVSFTHFTSPSSLEILVTTSEKSAPSPVAPPPAAAKPDKRAAQNKKPAAESEDMEPTLTNKLPLPQVPVLSDGRYVMELHHLKSPGEALMLSRVYFNEKPFALRSMDNELMVVTGSGVRFYNIEDMRKPIMNDMDRLDFEKPYDIAAIKPALVNNRLYALIVEDNRYKILVFSVLHPDEKVVLGDFDITEEQFDGASFSKGGQLFILPTTEGTLFYDMTELKETEEDKRIVAHWDLPSDSVDVAKNGRFICVALGAMGVYCGELLFY